MKAFNQTFHFTEIMITNLLYMNNLSNHTFTKIIWNSFKITKLDLLVIMYQLNKKYTVIKPEQDEVQSSSINHIYQNIQKKTAKRKNLDKSISLRKSKK